MTGFPLDGLVVFGTSFDVWWVLTFLLAGAVLLSFLDSRVRFLLTAMIPRTLQMSSVLYYINDWSKCDTISPIIDDYSLSCPVIIDVFKSGVYHVWYYLQFSGLICINWRGSSERFALSWFTLCWYWNYSHKVLGSFIKACNEQRLEHFPSSSALTAQAKLAFNGQ